MQPVLEEEPLLRGDGDIEDYTDELARSSVVNSSIVKSRDSITGVVASSLDFERIVNQYSIQAVRDQWLLPPLPSDGASSERSSGNFGGAPRHSARTNNRLRREERKLLGYTGRTATRWFLTALAGLLTGLTSNVIVSFLGMF